MRCDTRCDVAVVKKHTEYWQHILQWQSSAPEYIYRSSLLTLPREIRNEIYQQLFTSVAADVEDYGDSHRSHFYTRLSRHSSTGQPTAILRTCQQVLNEAAQVLYSKVVASFHTDTLNTIVLPQISQTLLQHVRITIPDSCYGPSVFWQWAVTVCRRYQAGIPALRRFEIDVSRKTFYHLVTKERSKLVRWEDDSETVHFTNDATELLNLAMLNIMGGRAKSFPESLFVNLTIKETLDWSKCDCTFASNEIATCDTHNEISDDEYDEDAEDRAIDSEDNVDIEDEHTYDEDTEAEDTDDDYAEELFQTRYSQAYFPIFVQALATIKKKGVNSIQRCDEISNKRKSLVTDKSGSTVADMENPKLAKEEAEINVKLGQEGVEVKQQR